MLSALLLIYFLLITLINFMLLSVIFCITAPFDRDRRVIHWLSRVWSKSYFSLFPNRLKIVEGLGNIERERAYVVVVNHRSMLDIAWLYTLPLRFKWVSKKEVYRWPLFGWVLRMHGDITIERGSIGGLRDMERQGRMWLDRGVSVVIFPEGSRNKADGVGRFKEGAFMMAKSAGVAILPCVTAGTGSWMNGWRVDFKNVYRLRVLPAIEPSEVEQASAKELALKVQQMIASEYEKIK